MNSRSSARPTAFLAEFSFSRSAGRKRWAAWDVPNPSSTTKCGSGVSAPALSTAAGQGSKVIDEPTSGSGTGGKAPAAAKAWQHAENGRLTEAEVEFARAILGQPTATALYDYGRCLVRVGR